MVRAKAGLIVALLTFMNLACSDSNILYKKKFDLPETGWVRHQKLVGTWTQERNVSSIFIVLDIMHGTDYGYQNLYLAGTIQDKKQILWTDTFSVQLARANSGQWLGKHFSGNTRIVSDTIPSPFPVANGEQIQYQFSQFSREEILPGIEALDILVISK